MVVGHGQYTRNLSSSSQYRKAGLIIQSPHLRPCAPAPTGSLAHGRWGSIVASPTPQTSPGCRPCTAPGGRRAPAPPRWAPPCTPRSCRHHLDPPQEAPAGCTAPQRCTAGACGVGETPWPRQLCQALAGRPLKSLPPRPHLLRQAPARPAGPGTPPRRGHQTGRCQAAGLAAQPAAAQPELLLGRC
jgi:hypothetical protein